MANADWQLLIANRQSAIGNRTMLDPSFYNPQCVPDRRPVLLWSVVLLLSLLLVSLIIAAPVATATEHGFVATVLYQAFSHVCHQQPERSFFIAGHPLAVCARCTGLYLGFAIATLLYPLLPSTRRTQPPARKWLFFALAPLVVDFGLGFFGIWENTHSSRFLTGALFGAVVALYVMPAVAELSHYLRPRRRTERPAPLWANK